MIKLLEILNKKRASLKIHPKVFEISISHLISLENPSFKAKELSTYVLKNDVKISKETFIKSLQLINAGIDSIEKSECGAISRYLLHCKEKFEFDEEIRANYGLIFIGVFKKVYKGSLNSSFEFKTLKGLLEDILANNGQSFYLLRIISD